MASIPLSHCASLVRDRDHDRYLCTLFAPPEMREAWFALFAFNHEIASIPEMVSEDMIGFMRFAWWREALDEIYNAGPVRRHPVAQALAETIASHQLPRAPFDTMLDAREKRFADKAMQERPEWEAYFRATSSSLLTLCTKAADIEASAATEALGIAWGCAGMTRVFLAMGDVESAVELKRAGQEWLVKAKDGLPKPFAPFYDTALFYIKRLGKSAKTARPSPVLLPLMLCLKAIIR